MLAAHSRLEINPQRIARYNISCTMTNNITINPRSKLAILISHRTTSMFPPLTPAHLVTAS